MENCIFSGQLQSELSGLLARWKHDRVLLLSDKNCAKHCLPLIPEGLIHETLILPAGEHVKSISNCSLIWKFMLGAGAGRQSLLICLGGGTITDLGGFAASTFKRGISFMHIPTTLLNMVDAAYGGKTGINFGDIKNVIGTFSEPKAVLVDPVFLRTLPVEEMQSAWAEVIKHALIDGKERWDAIRKMEIPDTTQLILWKALIQWNYRVKKEIVIRDPLEMGLRQVLNLGHSLGHAIESQCLKMGRDIKHGFAVAAGLYMEAGLAVKKGIMDPVLHEEIRTCVFERFPKVQYFESEIPDILSCLMQDKKNRDGRILMPLPAAPGDILRDTEVGESECREALMNYLHA